MKSYKDLEIYQLAFDLAIRVHFASLKLPKYELYEQGSQVRRSSKGIKDTIAEGFGRRNRGRRRRTSSVRRSRANI
ncbi:four helix bundle protein [Bacteroidota bacterium]